MMSKCRWLATLAILQLSVGRSLLLALRILKLASGSDDPVGILDRERWGIWSGGTVLRLAPDRILPILLIVAL